MFGYVVANRKELSDEQYSRYRKYYCSLCRAIGRRCGEGSRLTLSYDMCFLLMLLDSLYSPESVAESASCVMHPFKKSVFEQNALVDYCADMNVLLSYYSLLDKWNDDKNFSALSSAKYLEKKAMKICEQYGRQGEAIKRGLSEIAEAESRSVLNADIPANSFGRLMGELFAVYDDDKAPALRELGEALGRLIYIMDACVDFKSDIAKGQYNPLVLMTADSFEPMLCMLLGDCTVKLAVFNLNENGSNLDILKNILYSGVWTRYYISRRNDVKAKELSEGGKPEDE